jgi:RNA-directed DNA polymerase
MSVFDDPITKLRLAHSVQDVAFALNLDPAKFFYVIQNSENGSYYKKFEIPKKSGGVRQISRPLRGLALAQDRLSAVLTAHYKPKSFVKGYIKGESFFTNAKYHERQKWVLNLDIKDFFPSIHFGRVRGLFISQMFGFNQQVSTVLARIVTFENGLPQGASTSPIIANIIANNLDKQLIAIAAKERLRYTRYADDITFSSSQKTVPSALIKLWEPDKGNRQITLSSAVHDAFRQSNFAINEDKVRIQFPYERQEVTGLIVNKKANVWRRDVSKLRMKIHAARKHGAESAAKIFIGESADGEKFWQHITGWLAYVRQIRGNDDPVVAKLCKQAILAGLNGAEWIRRYADMVREFDIFLSHASEDKEK